MGEALLIFKSITKLTEIEGILQKLLALQQPLDFKHGADQTFSLKPFMMGTNLDLRCHVPEGESFNLSPGSICTAMFHLNDEKYFVETKVEKTTAMSVSALKISFMSKNVRTFVMSCQRTMLRLCVLRL